MTNPQDDCEEEVAHLRPVLEQMTRAGDRLSRAARDVLEDKYGPVAVMVRRSESKLMRAINTYEAIRKVVRSE